MARIMIADDSATERKHLMLSLKRFGHDLVEACDGEQAEDAIFSEKPDMVILDVVMPKKDGFQVCRDIKSRSEYKDIPVIMISGMNQRSDEYWGRKQGANEYLAKPLDMQNLIDTINKYLV